jgi:hypothetical protein
MNALDQPEKKRTAPDPIAFILSSNDKRRHMSKGARAMVAAKVRLLNNQSTRKLEQEITVSQAYIVKASVVLEYAPELADSVIDGARPLKKTYLSLTTRKRYSPRKEAALNP